MDLSNDLSALQELHTTYQRLIKNHQEQLINEQQTAEEIFLEFLKKKIQYFEIQKNLIEERINQLASETLRFSVEYLFKKFGFSKKSFQVTFLTTSDAYKTYGSYVTGVIIYSTEELMDLLQRFNSSDWNDGYVKFDDKVGDFTSEQKELLKTKGFLASEISQVAWV